MSRDIFFSIIICCYNSEKYLDDLIISILNQTYKNYEIVFVDDGSTDNTSKIINKYQDMLNYKYLYQKNQGFASARNLAINKSSYEWIVIIDHDDICLPNRLSIHKNQIIKNNNCNLFFANTIHFKDDGLEIRKNFDIFNLSKINSNKIHVMNDLLLHGCFIDSESVVFNKQSAIDVGLFETKFQFISDYDFFIKMGQKNDFNFTNQIVSKWRVHDTQASKKLGKIYQKENILLLLRYLLNKNVYLKIKFFIIYRLIKEFIKIFLRVLNVR